VKIKTASSKVAGSPNQRELAQDMRKELTKERDQSAAIEALKLGAQRYEWFPWPDCPQSCWVPIRTCTIPEIAEAEVRAHKRCEIAGRPGDEDIYNREYKLHLLSCAVLDGYALETGLNPDGTIQLEEHMSDASCPMFSDARHLEKSLSGQAAFDTLYSAYLTISRTSAPLSTLQMLGKEKMYLELLQALKKKPGPIDWTEFSVQDLTGFATFLVDVCPCPEEFSQG